MIKKKKILRAIISYIPILRTILRKRGTSPVNAEYYYNIYKNHIDALVKYNAKKSGTLMELGPGDTLGVGMCGILDGFSKYIAADVIQHFDYLKNKNVLLNLKKFFFNEKKYSELIKELQNEYSKLILYSELNSLPFESVDVIISNAVLEHVLDLDRCYSKMFDTLKPGGFCSHVIDYGAHEFS